MLSVPDTKQILLALDVKQNQMFWFHYVGDLLKCKSDNKVGTKSLKN